MNITIHYPKHETTNKLKLEPVLIGYGGNVNYIVYHKGKEKYQAAIYLKGDPTPEFKTFYRAATTSDKKFKEWLEITYPNKKFKRVKLSALFNFIKGATFIEYPITLTGLGLEVTLGKLKREAA